MGGDEELQVVYDGLEGNILFNHIDEHIILIKRICDKNRRPNQVLITTLR